MMGFILGSILGAILGPMLFDVPTIVAVSVLLGQLGTVAMLYLLGYIKTGN